MKKEIVTIGIILFFISYVSAGIYFSQPQSVYNLGDITELEATVSPILSDYLLNVNLLCGGDEVISFNNMPDSNGKVTIKFPLTIQVIKGTTGTCYFEGEYGDENKVKSRTF